MSLAGFHKAPLMQSIMGGVGVCSFLFSFTNWRPNLTLQLFPQITRYTQLWRFFTYPLFFTTSGEILFGSLILYNFRLFERRYGTAKFWSFVLVTFGLSTFFQIAFLVLGRTIDLKVAPGPYGLIFALYVPFYFDIPVTHTFQVAGINVSYKFLTYLLGLQLVLSNFPESVPSALSGIMAGLLYSSDFGSVQRWRSPKILADFAATYIAPYVVATSPYGNGWHQPRSRTGVLATLDAQGRPITTQIGNPGIAGVAGFPAARPQPAYIPPTEEQILNLERMGFARERILVALRRANNDENRAVNILVDEATQ